MDFKNIMWKETIQVNLVRSVCAGIVYAIGILLTGSYGEGSPLLILLFPIAIPIFYFGFFLPIGLICRFLARIGVPFVGIGTFVCSLFIVLGDPLVFFIHKLKKELVPMEKYGFFNFTIFIFVTKS